MANPQINLRLDHGTLRRLRVLAALRTDGSTSALVSRMVNWHWEQLDDDLRPLAEALVEHVGGDQ